MGVALSDGSFPHRTRPPFQIIQSSKSELGTLSKDVTSQRPRGAIVARLTPDQKVACSTHVVGMVFMCAISAAFTQ